MAKANSERAQSGRAKKDGGIHEVRKPQSELKEPKPQFPEQKQPQARH